MKNQTALFLSIFWVVFALLLGACKPADTQGYGSEPAISQTGIPVLEATAAPTEPVVEPISTDSSDPLVLEAFEHQISVDIPSSLAMEIEAVTVEAVEPSPEFMYVDSNPAHLRLQLLDFAGEQSYQLPYPMPAPQLAVFQTDDFAAYGADEPSGYPAQLADLQDLLETGLQPGACDRNVFDRVASDEPLFLPFLPWTNSAQVFCARAEVIEFGGGQGVRYLTYFSQGADPLMDPFLFYTFQGLTEDGKLYVSAAFPVLSGALPVTPPADYPNCIDPAGLEECKAIFEEQLQQLNSQAGEEFSPSLAALDAIVRSLVIGEQ